MGADRQRRLAAALAALSGVVVFLVSTELFPFHSLNHDEAVYLQQATMLREGQLAIRPPVEDAFRPWFFVEDGDRLYPKYAPVPAAMYAVGQAVGHARLVLAAVGAGIVAGTYAVGAAVFDRRTGLLAGAFVLASPLFFLDAAVFLPYAPTTALNLAFAVAYLRADRTGDWRIAAAAGAAIGLAFFARPFTAVLFALPFVGHALWTLSRDPRGALPRQAATAALGLAGVALALAYNAVQTGSPLLFPYQAFAPLDGLGFGTRRILGHSVEYTPSLALRANRLVIEQFLAQWIAGGVLGAVLAVAGLAAAVRRDWSARTAAVAGLFLTVPLGNVLFWGNYNVLGVLGAPGDGLIAYLGPYYHFDLLVPTAVFAGYAVVRGAEALRRAADRRVDARQSRAAAAAAVLVLAAALGAVTVGVAGDAVDRNAEVTAAYERAYAPFADGAPPNAVVFVPTPYGDWLNHPFQVLRNGAGFDADTVYALPDRPFAVADAFPDRRLYRYGYRGAWAPYAGSPEAARLQRIRDVSGDRVALHATLGVPAGARGVSVRVAAGGESAYYTTASPPRNLSLSLSVTDGRVTLDGPLSAVGNATPTVEGRERVVLTAFVDYGPAGGFTYRLAMPVDAAGDGVRALTPEIERCRRAAACGGAATYVPSTAPEGVFVRTALVAGERNP